MNTLSRARLLHISRNIKQFETEGVEFDLIGNTIVIGIPADYDAHWVMLDLRDNQDVYIEVLRFRKKTSHGELRLHSLNGKRI